MVNHQLCKVNRGWFLNKWIYHYLHEPPLLVITPYIINDELTILKHYKLPLNYGSTITHLHQRWDPMELGAQLYT